MMQYTRKLLMNCCCLSRKAFIKNPCFFKSEIQRQFLYSQTVNQQSTVLLDEPQKFGKHSSQWWEKNSMFYELMTLNELRVPFIRDGLLGHKKLLKIPKPLLGLKILDVGCGGGILTEPLARLGASVTGLDPSIDNINAAIQHAELDPELEGKVTYICDVIENFSTTDAKFDAIVCSEVVEHVNDLPLFIKCCADLTRDMGSLFFTTINQTMLSYWLVIFGYEYMLRKLPVGTHSWNQFVKPEDLKSMLEKLNCRTISVQGTMLNPITSKWCWSTTSNITYALHAIKEV